MEVIVKGQAKGFDDNYTEILGEDLERFDGIGDSSCFCDYMRSSRVSAADVSSGGYLSFKYEDGKLWSITEYESTRILSEIELEELKSYTQGQWSDGIGEGFEQRPCTSRDEYISPWFSNQEISCRNNIKEQRDEAIKEVLK